MDTEFELEIVFRWIFLIPFSLAESDATCKILDRMSYVRNVEFDVYQ